MKSDMMASDMKLKELKDLLSDKTIEERLLILCDLFPGKVIFTTSFGVEDQVITEKIFTSRIPVRVVTLDTGRLFPETYEVFSQTMIKYRQKIEVFFPEFPAVEKMVTEKGPFSFYDSVEDRKECCRIRKVVPLGRALSGMSCWVSGIRSDQSDNRSQMSYIGFDDEKKLFNFYPLFDWTLGDVEKYIEEKGIPYNALYNKGYLSIGCEPCTRPVLEGSDFRSGRWWWEQEGSKECGLHTGEK
jgi:phosphoadenosine phosphosulfate reductase